jgi:GntR family transcriptional regulator
MAKQPRYLSIASTIRRKISDGHFSPSLLLPSQKELARIFQTSVMTVRQALSVLEREGLIVFEHGVGTFVAPGGVNDRVLRLQGFQDEMEERSIRISTKILEKSLSVLEEKLSGLLSAEPTQRVCRIIRLRFLDEQPIVVQRSYLPGRYSNVLRNYTEDKSLYSHIGQTSGQILIRSHEIIRPIALPEEEATLLRRPEGTPAFLSLRLSSNLAGEAVLYDEAYLVGDRIFLTSQRLGYQSRFHYSVSGEPQKDALKQLVDPDVWEDW